MDLKLYAVRAAKGDSRAFRQVVDQTRRRLYALASRLMGDPFDAQEVLQDAYLSAFTALRRGRYDGHAKLETWLYRIVANACLDALRARRTRRKHPGPDLPLYYDSDSHIEARLALAELNALLPQLSPPCRSALMLVAIEGLTSKAAAEVLGCSESAVEQRLIRARTALRETQIGVRSQRTAMRAASCVGGPRS
jgi:RNA polymerase sigma-70 factor (ECF subfamily)